MARYQAFLLMMVVVASAIAKDTTTVAPDDTTTSEVPFTTKPTTTTESTTTTTTTTSTTTTETPKTTTTTTPAPTTVAPPPVPAEYPNNVNATPWFANATMGKNMYPCIVLKGAFAIRVDNATISVPANADATGACSYGSGSASLTLKWLRPGDATNTSVQFMVEKTNNTKGEAEYKFTKVIVRLPNRTDLVSNETLFEAPVDKSYKCTSESHVNLSQNGTQLVMQKLQAEAFPKSTDALYNDFHSAQECRSDDVSAVVPVAVGASLIVLVVIVLVAYIIGRRRSRARGYQSV